jgi:hypothetical protein
VQTLGADLGDVRDRSSAEPPAPCSRDSGRRGRLEGPAARASSRTRPGFTTGVWVRRMRAVAPASDAAESRRTVGKRPRRSARRLARGHSRKLRQVPVDNNVHRVRRLYGGWTLSDESVRTLVENSDQPVDEAVLGRLRHAITSDGGEEEQLNGVLRMLGAEAPSKNQLPLFGKAPAGQAPKATTKTVDGA